MICFPISNSVHCALLNILHRGDHIYNTNWYYSIILYGNSLYSYIGLCPAMGDLHYTDMSHQVKWDQRINFIKYLLWAASIKSKIDLENSESKIINRQSENKQRS